MITQMFSGIEEQKNGIDRFELKIKESCINHQFAWELNLRGKQSDVLSAIYIVSSSSGVCFATNEWISNHFRLCKNTISNYVKKFEKLGLLVSEHFKRIGKHIRNLYLTEKFFEMAEKCECTRIKRNIETWEEKRAKRENAKKMPAKPIKSTYAQNLVQRINNISKDIYIERKDTTFEVKPKKKELLKSYNLVIKEYVDLNFSSDKGLETLLRRFVRVQFKRNRRNDKNWFMLNDELKDHLDELLKLSKGCLLSACAIARLTVVQEWGKFYPLTNKKALHVDKFLQERMQPLFTQVRAHYNEIYGVQSIDEIYGINDGVVNKHKKFEEELSEIKTMVCDLRIELDKRKSLGIGEQTNQGTALITNHGDIVELMEDEQEETWEEKYGCMDAINYKEYIDIFPESHFLGATNDFPLQKGNFTT